MIEIENKSKKFLKNFTFDELEKEMLGFGLEKYRAKQVYHDIYVNRANSFNEITTLPKSVRADFEEKYEVLSLAAEKVRRSVDGSVKFLFRLHDGKNVEAVYMPWYENEFENLERVTLCISSMAGCPVDCAFCATGKLGMQRNLDAAEIIDQIFAVEKEIGNRVTNIVFMGMGEPLLNFNNVSKVIDILTDERSAMMGRRRITLSTVGIIAKIRQLALSTNPPKLAISLHATTQGFREKIIPLAKNYNISELMDSVEYYYRATKMPLTYEYILFDGMNDTFDDAKRLAKIAKRVPSRVNIIPYNDISFTNPTGFAAELKATPMSRIKEFASEVRSMGGIVIVRDTFGADIEAACGQLALSNG